MVPIGAQARIFRVWRIVSVRFLFGIGVTMIWVAFGGHPRFFPDI